MRDSLFGTVSFYVKGGGYVKEQNKRKTQEKQIQIP